MVPVRSRQQHRRRWQHSNWVSSLLSNTSGGTNNTADRFLGAHLTLLVTATLPWALLPAMASPQPVMSFPSDRPARTSVKLLHRQHSAGVGAARKPSCECIRQARARECPQRASRMRSNQWSKSERSDLALKPVTFRYKRKIEPARPVAFRPHCRRSRKSESRSGRAR